MTGFIAVCPHCGFQYRNTPQGLSGQGVACRHCGKKFLVRLVGESPARPGPAPTVPSRRLDAAGADNAWSIGETILGLYQVTGFLGQGGMGRVYKVRHLDWGVDLAVKTPLVELLAGSKGAENFEREAETWVNLGLHPHTISCYYVRRVNGAPSVFAEYAAGGSLHDWIRNEDGGPGRLFRGGPAAVLARVVDIGIQFAWGLKYAHDHGLIHLDVKPANVMMTPQGLVKVTDFGLAMAASKGGLEAPLDHDRELDPQLRSIPGTPQYFSPEQAAGQVVTRQTDIWSWGLCLLELFKGGRTWEMGAVAEAVLEDHLASGGQEKWLPPLPPALADLLRRCFRIDPGDRPRDLGEAASFLIDFFQKTFRRDYPRQEPKPGLATADSLNNRAVSLRDLGRSAEAEVLWDSALQSHPHHLEASYNQGLVQWRAGRLADDALVSRIVEARRSHPDHQAGAEALAFVNLERGAFREALQILKENNSSKTKQAAEDARKAFPKSNRLLWSTEIPEGGAAVVAFSRDQKTALAGGDDQRLRIWDLATGKLVKVLESPCGIRALALSRDGRVAVSGGGDFSTKDFRLAVWDLSQGRIIKFLEGHQKGVGALDLDADGRVAVSAGDDRAIMLWDLDEGKRLASMSNNKSALLSVRLTLGGSKVISGDADGAIRIWDAHRSRALGVLAGHQGLVTSLSLSPDGRFVLSGGSDRTVKYWDLAGRQLKMTLTGHHDEISSVRLFQTGRHAVSAGLDRTIRLWDLETGRCLRTLEGHESWVRSMDLSPDGKLALSGGLDRTLRLWRVDPQGETIKAPMFIAMVSSSEVAHTAGSLYENSLTGAKGALEKNDFKTAAEKIREARSQAGFARGAEALTLWAKLYGRLPKTGFAGGWEERSLSGSSSDVEAVAINRTGDLIASGSADRTAALWNSKTGERLARLKNLEGDVKTVCFSPDGRLVLAGGGDGAARLWSSTSAELVAVMEKTGKRILCSAFSPDGRLIFTGGEDGKIHVWDWAAKTLKMVLAGSRTPVNVLRPTPDGRSLVAASGDFTGEDNLVRLWDLSSQKVVLAMTGHQRSVNTLDLIPGRREALSGGSDGTFRLWDLTSGREMKTIPSGRGAVQSLSVSGDGLYFLAGFFDNSLGLWELAAGREARFFEGHTAPVTSTALSRDGRFAVSGSRDGLIKIWSLDWLLGPPPERTWDDAADPRLADFIALHAREGLAGLEYQPEDFEALLQSLGEASLGWIAPAQVRRRLEEMTGSRPASTPEEDNLAPFPDHDQVLSDTEERPVKKRSWWSRLFGRKSD
ncbi:MAG: protein kinase [Pseudomonadota bacterium]